MVIPRVHDCISLLLGSRRQYDSEFDQFPGTYYLSKGWKEYKNYQRVVFIRTVNNCEEYIKYSKEVADFLNLKFHEAEGSAEYLRKLVHGEWDKEFLIIPPGKPVLLDNFL